MPIASHNMPRRHPAPPLQAGGGGLVVSAEVAAALVAGQPVVALESTIISHGMPYPQNLQTAQQVEAVVRAHGAVPATIAVLAGVPHVGLTPAQLQALARGGTAMRKVSRRDLPLVMALQLDGATTVSATMLLAARAGIQIFVTGGEADAGRCWVASACDAPAAAARVCDQLPNRSGGTLPVHNRHRRRAPRWRDNNGRQRRCSAGGVDM